MASRLLLAHLGLGSNLGDRWAHLGRAVDRLAALDPGLAVSPIYETAPVGGPSGQRPYLNAVVACTLELEPAGFLELAGALESEALRVREARFGPRTLDVDVLLLHELTDAVPLAVRIDLPSLVVPHPRMYERAFVLAPLEDLAPELVPAGWRDALGGAEAVAAAVRRVGELVRVPGP